MAEQSKKELIRATLGRLADMSREALLEVVRDFKLAVDTTLDLETLRKQVEGILQLEELLADDTEGTPGGATQVPPAPQPMTAEQAAAAEVARLTAEVTRLEQRERELVQQNMDAAHTIGVRSNERDELAAANEQLAANLRAAQQKLAEAKAKHLDTNLQEARTNLRAAGTKEEQLNIELMEAKGTIRDQAAKIKEVRRAHKQRGYWAIAASVATLLVGGFLGGTTLHYSNAYDREVQANDELVAQNNQLTRTTGGAPQFPVPYTPQFETPAVMEPQAPPAKIQPVPAPTPAPATQPAAPATGRPNPWKKR